MPSPLVRPRRNVIDFAISEETSGNSLFARLWQTWTPWFGQGLIVLLLVLGLALRLRQYLFNRSFIYDEASLALNILDRDLSSLLTAPLDHTQSAPPGFLAAARFVVDLAGPHDWALRVVPLVAGLLLLPLAYVLARHEFRSLPARLAFVGLVALSPTLIYYSSEFKQYSSDALVALGILVAVSYRKSRYGSWLLAAAGFVGIVCSLPALFVAAAAGLLIVYEGAISSRWRQVISVGLAWGAGAALHGLYLLQAVAHHEYMVSWWGKRSGFAPFPPTSVEELLWYPRSLAGLTYLSLRNVGMAEPGLRADWSAPLGWLLTLMLAVSIVAALVSRRLTCIVAINAALITLLASTMQIYPFNSRLLIFLVPLTLFVVAAAIDELDRLSGPVAAGVGAMLLFALIVPTAIGIAQKPPFVFAVRAALEKIHSDYRDGDAIAIAKGSTIYEFYERTMAPSPLPVFAVNEGDKDHGLIDLVEKNGYRRVWLVSPRRIPKVQRLIQQVARKAPIVFEWNRGKTGLVLFDFTRH
jgi:hypothetical protein